MSIDDGRFLLPNPKGLCCNSLVGTCQRLQTASLSATATSSTIGPAGSYGSNSRAACMALSSLKLRQMQTESKKESQMESHVPANTMHTHKEQLIEGFSHPPICTPSLVLSPTQSWWHFGSLGKWAGVIHSNENYLACKIQRSPQGIIACQRRQTQFK